MGCCGDGLRKIRNIALGWRRLANGFTAEWADERKIICDGCDEQNLLGFCKECWCAVRAKVLVEGEFCKLGKWLVELPQIQAPHGQPDPGPPPSIK